MHNLFHHTGGSVVRPTLVIMALLLFLLAPTIAAQEDDAASCPTGDYETGLFAQEIISDNTRRETLVYVPESYDSTQPTALIISFHGFSSNPEDQIEITGWNDVADEHGFIVAYPRGLGRPPRWNSGDFPLVQGEGANDVLFTQDIVSTLSEIYCIDAVFPNGYSNGGGLSNRLACELSAEFGAFGGVAGAYNTPPEGCNPEEPVRVIGFHGTNDSVVSFSGREALRLPPVLDWLAFWADHNGCDPEPEISQISDEVTEIRYLDCEVDVVLYEIAGGGHTWPGGEIVGAGGDLIGYVTMDINASELMWEFFSDGLSD